MKKKGKGRKDNAAKPLTEDEEDLLWKAKQLGSDSPQTLYNTMHFGWRGRDEHRKVCLGDFHVGQDSNGTDYVEFDTERGTKTRRGMEWETGRAFNPRMYATGDERCPVKHFTLYLSLRPLSASTPDLPLYMLVTNNLKPNVWYKNQPIGVNTLGGFMKKIAGLTGKKTNHSARKTMVTRLIQNEVHLLHVTQLSGHNNL